MSLNNKQYIASVWSDYNTKIIECEWVYEAINIRITGDLIDQLVERASVRIKAPADPSSRVRILVMSGLLASRGLITRRCSRLALI